MKRSALSLFSVIALAACSAPEVPDESYFRLPAVAIGAGAVRGEPGSLPIVVDPLRAHGVYNDQSILYALDDEGSIKAYHYQLWDEAPGVLLQRRLIESLRARRAAEMITDRLPATLAALRIGGTIERFERVKTAAGWIARVRLEIRVEEDNLSAPLLLGQYGADVPAENATIQASVRAFGQAVDQSYAAFWSEFSVLERR